MRRQGRRVVEQVEQRDLAGQRDPRQRRFVAPREAGLGIDVCQERFRGFTSPLAESRDRRPRPAPLPARVAGSRAARPVRGTCARFAAPARGRSLASSARPSGGRVCECQRSKAFGIVAAVVEEAAGGSQGRVEVASRTRLIPERARRSASASARRARRSGRGTSATPKKRARPPLVKWSRPSRT